MVKKSISDVLIKIKGDNKDLNGALKSSDTSLSNFASSVGHRLKQASVAFVALGVAASVYSVKQSMTFEGLERAFNRMVSQQGKDADKFMRNMKGMSEGTVAGMEIMKRANMGMLLGLKTDEILTFMEAATTISQATGESVGYMFESLVTGTARQSKLWLDNLGILIDVDAANQAYADTLGIQASALTEAQRKLAFVNAASKESSKKITDLGGFVLDTKAKWDQLITTFKDASVELGQRLMPEFDKILTWLLENKNWMVQTFDDIFDIEIPEFGDAVVKQLDNVKNWIDENKGDIKWWVDSIKGISEWRTEVKAKQAAMISGEDRPSLFGLEKGEGEKRWRQSISIVLDHFAVDKFLKGEVIKVTDTAVISGT